MLTRAFFLLCLSALAGCQYLNPNAGRFSCDGGADCGSGYECRPQFEGGGRCFKLGECVDDETCDGVDQNCDGRIDETFPEAGEPCMTGLLGRCSLGARTCTVGALSCGQTVMPTGELCNTLDDDCDGMTDETFDLTADEQNCGQCARVCGAGTTCLSSACEETTCNDGFDNDNDGVTDCLDTSCLGLECVTPMPPPWKCGVIMRTDAGTDGGSTDAGLSDGGTDGGASDAGASDGGSSDGGSSDGGMLIFGCFPPESDCGNGLDDDGDGAADCLDIDCDTRTCASGTMCTNLTCPGPG